MEGKVDKEEKKHEKKTPGTGSPWNMTGHFTTVQTYDRLLKNYFWPVFEDTAATYTPCCHIIAFWPLGH